MAENKSLDELLAEVTANATLGGSLIELFKLKKKELADALSGTTIPPAVQAKIDAIFNVSAADSAAISEALLENTPEGEGGGDTGGETPPEARRG